MRSLDLRGSRALPLELFEEAVCVLVLMFFAVQGAIPGIAPNQALETNLAAASALTRIGGIASQALVYGFILLLCVIHGRLVIRGLQHAVFATGLGLWVVASTVWSLDPGLTARRSAAFALAGLFGVFFIGRFTPDRQLKVLWRAMMLLALATVVVCLFLPQVGLERSAGHAGDWQGVFTQKNACGRIMVLATAVALGQKRRWQGLASAALFAAIVGLSGSRGAWAVEGLVVLGALVVAAASRMDRRLRWALLTTLCAGLTVCGAVVWMFRMQIMESLGRDATLSGRAGIWQAVWQRVQQRPLAGYGYGAFWRGWTGPSFEVSASVHFLVFHAHNGYLDLWLQTGLVGLMLFAAAYAGACVRACRLLVAGSSKSLLWPVFLLAMIGLYGLDENTLLIPNGLFWVLFAGAVAEIGRAAARLPSVRNLRLERLHYAKSLVPSE